MPLDKEQLWSQFAAAGEDKVRENIIAQRYGQSDSYKERFALEWLREKEQERVANAARRAEELIAEQIEIARSVKNATWVAASAAIIAAIIAVVSAIVTVAWP